MRVALLSNITVSSLQMKLEQSGEHQILTAEGYDSWMQNLLPGGKIFEQKPDVIVLLLDGNALLESKNAKDSRDFLEGTLEVLRTTIANHPKIPFIISTLDIESKILLPLLARRSEKENSLFWRENLQKIRCYPLDLEEMILEHGREKMYSRKLWYLGNMPFTSFGEEKIALRIRQLIRAYEGKRKKVLLLDLDNTLWGGVVGEEGLQGISLASEKEGKRYQDFQKRILELKNMGVMLAIVSKNNEEDAMEVFRKHPAMVLKEEDFVAMKINWKPKTENIPQLAEELNVATDSFVLIDDSAFEQESVRQLLPQVCVPEFPKDTTRLSDWMRDLAKEYFLFLETTEEDLQRTQMYRADFSRKQMQQSFQDIDSYLRSLAMVLDIHPLTTEDIGRAAQLTQKTNQFNVTTRRYTEADILRMKEDASYRIWIGSVRDRFGDYGKVVLLICHLKEHIATVDTFLMSCRVMERFVEDAVIDWIEQQLRTEGIDIIRAEYKPTQKNKPVEHLWERLGYSSANTVAFDLAISEAGWFERNLQSELPPTAERKKIVTVA